MMHSSSDRSYLVVLLLYAIGNSERRDDYKYAYLNVSLLTWLAVRHFLGNTTGLNVPFVWTINLTDFTL